MEARRIAGEVGLRKVLDEGHHMEAGGESAVVGDVEPMERHRMVVDMAVEDTGQVLECHTVAAEAGSPEVVGHVDFGHILEEGLDPVVGTLARHILAAEDMANVPVVVVHSHNLGLVGHIRLDCTSLGSR